MKRNLSELTVQDVYNTATTLGVNPTQALFAVLARLEDPLDITGCINPINTEHTEDSAQVA